jgi:hypothetical protein
MKTLLTFFILLLLVINGYSQTKGGSRQACYGPDLIVSAGSVSGGSIQFTISNASVVASPGCLVKITQWFGNTITNSTISVPLLSSTSFTSWVPVSTRGREGSVTFSITVNYNNQVYECRETNNTLNGNGLVIL